MPSWDDATDDDWDDAEVERSPICQECGVSMLPAETPGAEPVCENPDCDAYGSELR